MMPMPILGELQRQEFMASYPGWTIEEETIWRTFRFPSFAAAMGFVVRVALLAEKADHHPDIDIRWNKVLISLTTHAEGGLTEKDTELAGAIDRSA